MLCTTSILVAGCNRPGTIFVNPTDKSVYVDARLKPGAGSKADGEAEWVKLDPGQKLRSPSPLDHYIRITVEGGPDHSFVVDEAALRKLSKECHSPCTVALRQRDARLIRGE